jgi:hypothetical protein
MHFLKKAARANGSKANAEEENAADQADDTDCANKKPAVPMWASVINTEKVCSTLKRVLACVSVARLMAGMSSWRVNTVVKAISNSKLAASTLLGPAKPAATKAVTATKA